MKGEHSVPDDPLARSARGVYGISVASELSGIDAQTLRLYERRGLLTPARTDGGTRRYSDADVSRIQRIASLLEGGVTLAGAGMVLDLEDDNADLTARNKSLQARNTALSKDNERLRDEADTSPDDSDT